MLEMNDVDINIASEQTPHVIRTKPVSTATVYAVAFMGSVRSSPQPERAKSNRQSK
jgi:hypothetical protein